MQTSSVVAADGPLWAFMARQSPRASDGIGAKSGIFRAVINAP
jgi:hypothetical protein